MRAAFLTAVLFCACLAQAQFGDILKRANEALNQRSTVGLSSGRHPFRRAPPNTSLNPDCPD